MRALTLPNPTPGSICHGARSVWTTPLCPSPVSLIRHWIASPFFPGDSQAGLGSYPNLRGPHSLGHFRGPQFAAGAL
jgi:hypothetical protein